MSVLLKKEPALGPNTVAGNPFTTASKEAILLKVINESNPFFLRVGVVPYNLIYHYDQL
jgi:hypothetical protein